MSEKQTSIRDAYANFKKNPELNGEKLLACLENYRISWLGERQKVHDTQFKQNVGFYSGNHSIREKQSANNGYRVRVRENHVNNSMNRMLSIFTQNMPITRVFPNSIEWDDVRDAEVSEAYIKNYYRTKNLEQKFIKWIKYSAIFGSAFIFRSWDSQVTGKMIVDADESKSGNREIKKWKGDTRVDIDDPFKIVVRPGVEEMEDLYDFFRSIPVNKHSLECQYGEIQADPAMGFNPYSGSIRKDDDSVMQHHYYHAPKPWFPEGLYVCYAGKKLLKVSEEYPYEDGKLPLGHLPFDQAPMRFYGTSSIEQVMDLQEQLNRAAGMIVEARNLIARPRAFVSEEAKMPGQAITDRPGEIYRYKLAGGKPEFFVPPFNFAEMAAHKSDVRNALQQVVGITSASRGDIPAATRTALALQLVLEQDRSQYLPFIKNIHSGILDLMYGILGIAAEYIPESDPRMLKIESGYGVHTFHGGLVPDPLDMYLEDTNPLGWTAAGRIEQVGVLIDKGLVKDEGRALEMLKLPSTDPAMELRKINKQAANQEIELLNKGIPVEIGPEDDDETHLDEHVKIPASFSTWRKLPQAVKDAHTAHIAAHKERLSKAQPGPQGGAPKQGGITPSQMAGQVAPPQPGQNIEALLAQ